MAEPKPLASLTPTLLARKGGAKPAMRPQLQPMTQFHEATARQLEDDLGWNDMGHAHDDHHAFGPGHEAEVVALPMPEVVRQQQMLSARVEWPARPRRSALADGRRAAFTLRMDEERHLALRLACTLSNRSAQQIVTEALDKMIADLPDISTLAAKLGRHRKSAKGD